MIEFSVYRKKNVVEQVYTGFRFVAEFQDAKFEAFNIEKKLFNEFKVGSLSLNHCIIGKKFNKVWKENQLQMMIAEYRLVIC